jgi:molecular chaperone GrpE
MKHEKKPHEHTEETIKEEKEMPANDSSAQTGPVSKSSEKLAEEYLADLQRVQADFANYKKRQQESQKELAGYLIEKLVMEITPVLDNFHMATEHVPADACNTPWVMGISYIEKQLEKVLVDNGLIVIDAKAGDVFDPHIHEAVSQETEEISQGDTVPQEASEVKQPIVAKVLQKGYKIGEKVIRPVKVMVGMN